MLCNQAYTVRCTGQRGRMDRVHVLELACSDDSRVQGSREACSSHFKNTNTHTDTPTRMHTSIKNLPEQPPYVTLTYTLRNRNILQEKR